MNPNETIVKCPDCFGTLTFGDHCTTCPRSTCSHTDHTYDYGPGLVSRRVGFVSGRTGPYDRYEQCKEES